MENPYKSLARNQRVLPLILVENSNSLNVTIINLTVTFTYNDLDTGKSLTRHMQIRVMEM